MIDPAVMTENGVDWETRWSANDQADAVLSLLGREKLAEPSSQLRVEAHRLTAWRDEFWPLGRDGSRAEWRRDGVIAEERRRLREANARSVSDPGQRHPARCGAKERGLEIPLAKRRSERRAVRAADPGLPRAGGGAIHRDPPRSAAARPG